MTSTPREIAERDKYRRAWRTEAYQRHSPGLLAAPIGLEWYRTNGCGSLTDYGCGDGRAMRWFAGRGVDVCGVDLVGGEFGATGAVSAPLWSLPDTLPSTDFAFCCDVLEHLPPEQVEASLIGIALRTRRAGFFQIATRPDVVGPRDLGEPLHLTVEDAEWWTEQVERVFWVRQVESNGATVRLWVLPMAEEQAA